MSETGKPRTPGAPVEGAARPASSLKQDAVSEAKGVTGATSASAKAAPADKATETVRVRPPAADRKWQGEPARNGSEPADGASGTESTAVYPRPSFDRPVASGGSPTPGAPPAGPAPARSGADGAAQQGQRPAAFGAAESQAAGQKSNRTPRRAHLVVRRIEPWSAMKFSFIISLVAFVVLFVAVAVLYGVLSSLGVFSTIIDTVTQLTGSGENGQQPVFDIASWFDPVRILGYTALVGAVNVVLITALSTIGAVIYNLSAELVGGIEVTLTESE